MADDRRGRVAAMCVDHRLHAVGRQHFQRAGECGFGQRMRVHAQEQRPVNALSLAIQANRLRDRQDVGFVESAGESRTAMSGRSECDALSRQSAGSGASSK